MYKGVLFFDYDGTLTDKNEKIFFPTEKTRSAIKLLQKKGYIACLATGRSLVYVPQIEIDFDCMITNNGGYTFYKNKDKMKEIQVALRSLQLRKKERNERNYFNRCSHGNVCLWFLYHG